MAQGNIVIMPRERQLLIDPDLPGIFLKARRETFFLTSVLANADRFLDVLGDQKSIFLGGPERPFCITLTSESD